MLYNVIVYYSYWIVLYFAVFASEDNSKFVTAGGDKHFFQWDVTSGNIIRKFVGHDRKVYIYIYIYTHICCSLVYIVYKCIYIYIYVM